MKQFRQLTLLLLGVIAAVSCDTSVLQEKLDNLEQRISDMEVTVGSINDNTTAIRALMSGNIRIVGQEKEEFGYTLSLSDGTEVKVTYGSEAPYLIPIIGIDKDGNWIMSYDGGETFTIIEKASGAFAEDGVTPLVKIDTEGFWTISYDGGETYEYILNEHGKPISAVDSGSAGSGSFFEDVSYNESESLMIFKMKDGQELSVPVIGSFWIELEGYEPKADIVLGQTLTFKAKTSDVKDGFFTVPDGWQATLDDRNLTVTAPNSGLGGEYTIRLVLTSKDGYLKMYDYVLTLNAINIEDTYCQEYRDFLLQNEDNLLLDFSYAGYMHGETAPPEASTLGYTVYNVCDYGADGSDRNSDREAFINCLKAALGVNYTTEGNDNNGYSLTFAHKASAKAIIYFPEGTFILHDENDNELINGVAKTRCIQIRSGDIVLRGAGRDKTIIEMAAPAQAPKTDVLYSSPTMLKFTHWTGLQEIGKVTANAAKGSYSVTVDNVANLAAGDWVSLDMVNNDPACVANELKDITVSSTWTNIHNTGVQVYDYHQIAGIEGNVITFKEPIMHEVDLQYTSFTGKSYNWRICKYNHQNNVGVEDLTFKGHAKADYVHHGDWDFDGGYKPLSMMRVTNAWLRRVNFVDVTDGCAFSNCANVSAYDINFSGNRGHEAVRADGSSRVFIGAVNDNSIYNGVAAGQFHSVGVAKQSMGTVIWRCQWGNESCFESHATQPRATLIDCCRGGWIKNHQGGDIEQLPNHLDDLTVWNFNATTNNITNWWESGNSNYWKFLPPTIIGFHGASSSFNPDQVKADRHNGTVVSPESLYEEQLKARLGAVPAWLNSLK